MGYLYSIMGLTCLVTVGAMAAGDLGSKAKKTEAAAHMAAPTVVAPTVERTFETSVEELVAPAPVIGTVGGVNGFNNNNNRVGNRLDRLHAFAPGLGADEQEVAFNRWQERLDVARDRVQKRNLEARNAPKSNRNARRSTPRRAGTYSSRPRARTALGRYSRTNVLQRSKWRKKVRRYIGGSSSGSNYNTGRYRRNNRIGSSREYR